MLFGNPTITGFKKLICLGRPTEKSIFFVSSHTSREYNRNVKVFFKCIPHTEPSNINQIVNEHDIQKSLDHLYIMPIIQVFEQDNCHYFEMPRATGPISNGILQNPKQIYKVMFQITHAVNYLHSCLILHCDINPNNIVLMNDDSENPFPRIIDFGLSRKLESSYSSCEYHGMTKEFSSPEVLRFENHSFPSDIWSLGATFYYMITHKIPKQSESGYVSLSYDNTENNPLNFGSNFPPSGKALISKMTNPIPEKRPTAEMCMKDQFFAEVIDNEWIKKELTKINQSSNDEYIAQLLSPKKKESNDDQIIL